MRAATAGAIVLTLVLCVGCGGGEARPPGGCDFDEDCPAGEHCGPGGCRAECREARDCVALGAAASCDERGRCVVAMDGGTGGCTAHEECANGAFCDGVEYCNALDPSADSRGCVSPGPPCGAADCDEATDTCDPCRDPDEDRDLFDDVACGGRDCDDSDPRINPGMPEVCDDEAIDEDCNIETVGAASEDSDRDGHFPETCCNERGGLRYCGDDCSDSPRADTNAARRYPGLPETCDGIDNDCNGLVDDGQTVIFYRDADEDGFGIAIPPPVRERDGSLPPEVAPYARLGCVTSVPLGWSLTSTDCDDRNRDVRPGAAEDCTNGRDDNCNGSARDGCGCLTGEEEACGGHRLDGSYVGAVGACRDGARLCASSFTFGECSGQDASREICNAFDDDCTGVADDGLTCTLAATAGCIACGGGRSVATGTRTCEVGERGDCAWAPRCSVTGTVFDQAAGHEWFSRTAFSGFYSPCVSRVQPDGNLYVVETPVLAGCTAFAGPTIRLPAGSWNVQVDWFRPCAPEASAASFGVRSGDTWIAPDGGPPAPPGGSMSCDRWVTETLSFVLASCSDVDLFAFVGGVTFTMPGIPVFSFVGRVTFGRVRFSGVSSG